MCSGKTKARAKYEEMCKPGTCAQNEECRFNGCVYSGSGSMCAAGTGLECKCENPNVIENGKCVQCARDAGYDQEKQIWKCKQA